MYATSIAAHAMPAEALRVAVDHAFTEARSCLIGCGSLAPFTIMCASDGYDIVEHHGRSARDIYRSVRDLLAREKPEAYAFVYDGFVDVDAGHTGALICEAACRGDAMARLMVLPYRAGAAYSFAESSICMGTVRSLFADVAR